MSPEIITKKLEQIETLLDQLQNLLDRPFKKFKDDFMVVGTTERYFQLMVDLASDINTQLLVEKGQKTPDTYKQSFTEMSRAKILTYELSRRLTDGAKIRNILVHEYDLEEDYEKLYKSIKTLLPTFREYTKRTYDYIQKK